jgi:membrane fusion protein (multidrug efflux system)
MATFFRAKWLLIPIALILLVGAYGAWNYFSKWESTDDAQVDGHIHPVNARVGGTVMTVAVKENQFVEQGAVLAQIDARDYEIAVARAEADLAQARAAVVGARAGVPIASSTAGTQITSAEAIAERAKSGVDVATRELEVAQTRVTAAQSRVREAQANAVKTSRDLDRMKQLIAKDEVSQQQYDAAVSAAEVAHAAVDTTQAGVAQAQHELAVAQAKTAQSQAELQQARAEAEGTKTAPQQVVITRAQAQSAEARAQLAQSALDQARLNLEYTTIKAPVAGIVSKKSIEAGQVVQPGQPLMAVVPQEDIWITANFKETQLADMHQGQTATISVDAFGGRVLNAHVDSIASATGAKFSLLPPENATGNYVKVVQRIPVKLVFEAGQDAEHQLRPGMSTVVKVRVK